MMKEASKNYISQYKLLFYLSWIALYFIFPAWRFPQIYISFTNELIEVSYSKKIVGFLAYFFISAYLLNFFLKSIFIDKPLFTHSANWSKLVKENLWLILICCVAAVLHIFSYSLAVGTAAYALWIYNFITSHWNKLLGFPIQYPVWISLFILIFILKQKKTVNFLSSCLNSGYSLYKSSNTVKLIFIVFITGIFISYTKLIPYYSFWDHLFITGEAPLGTVLYLIIYLLFGTGNILIAPVVVQFTFYILSGIFLYKTINLFCEKETALLGSSLYLFSPIIFTYATLGHLQSGVVFFIILTSYFFLKFTRDGHNKDLILTAYFISMGSLYKREIILMLIICSAYLIVNKIKQKDFTLKKHITQIKILSLSLLSFLPWMFIGTRGGSPIIFSHLTAPESLFSYLLMIPTQLSWPIFLLFLLSIIFIIITPQNHLSIFFGIVFILYYALYTSLQQQTVHRYSMAFYPTISIFLAQIIYGILQKIRWRPAFKLVSLALIIYLAILCILPRSSTKLITFKYTDFENQIFPAKKAIEWILNQTRNDERVLILYASAIKGENLPKDKFYSIPTSAVSSFFPSGDLEEFRQNLKDMCRKLKISYIMFPAGKAHIGYPIAENRQLEVRKFLEEDKYDDFYLTAKFNIDDNYIYIYKLNDNFVEKQ
jgi:hypothetical protein